MVGEMHPAKKIDTGSKSGDGDFVRMEIELQSFMKEVANARQKLHEPVFVMGKEDEVIGIAEVILGLELVLYPLMELVHVDIH